MTATDTVVTVAGQRAPAGRPATPTVRTARPVLWWAGVGAIFLAVQLYAYVRWLIDLPSNTTAGPTHVPAYMAWNIHAQEIAFPLITIYALYRFIARPLIRHQPVAWDGIFVGALLTLAWQNWGVNWFKWWANWNAVVINRGSWYNFVPFWTAPNARHFAEAPVWDFGFYGFWAVACIWLCFLLRSAKRRWPHLGKVGTIGLMFAFCMVLDLAAETLWMRGGLYHYGGAPRGWFLLFSGHYYQYPLYEMPLFGGCIAAMALVRHFRNARGESVAERRIDDVRIGRAGKTWLRWLALVGIVNVIFLAFNLSEVPPVLRSGGAWPADIQKRSYFTQQICGAKTDRACGGEGIPSPTPESAYLTPAGGLGHPNGWKPPGGQVPFAK